MFNYIQLIGNYLLKILKITYQKDLNGYKIPGTKEVTTPAINGNDVYNFTRNQVEDLLYYVGAGTYYTASLYYYGYSQYVAWALTQGLVRDGQNHFNEIEYSTLPIYINNMRNSTIS